MKKILFVWSMTCKPTSYIQKALDTVKPEEMTIHRVFLDGYPEFDDSSYDGLIYNTFAADWHQKFNKEVCKRTDEKYLSFKGKKILLDSHDDGTVDGMERFNDKKNPRIKYTPGYEFMKEYNVIISIPIKVWWVHIYRGEEKTNLIAYTGRKVGFNHTIREDVAERLKPYGAFMDRQKSINAAGRILRKSKIGIGVPGWGPIGSAHNETLAAKAVLFSHEDVKKVKILPFAELSDDISYVSFNMDNLEEKLSNLINDEEKIKYITEDGNKVFKIGYNPRRTAEEILQFFKED